MNQLFHAKKPSRRLGFLLHQSLIHTASPSSIDNLEHFHRCCNAPCHIYRSFAGERMENKKVDEHYTLSNNALIWRKVWQKNHKTGIAPSV
jgi:hypothetical protein